MILHCDGNSFYASCEQIYRPDLRGKPVVVLSNNDGIIIAQNKEAKALGLQRGDPFFKVEQKCKDGNVNVFSSNYTLYADISRRITSIYMEYAPLIEEYSIDESFLFFDKCLWKNEEFEEIGFELKHRILKEVGMPICVGAAPTKTLAKLYNKKAKEHNGVFVYDAETADRLLEETPAEKIWGIGPARARKLALHGIRNALQLKNMDLTLAKKLMTIQGYATVEELRGKPNIDLVVREKHECVTSSRQFSKKIFDVETIECAVVQYTQLAVEKLRKQKSEAHSVSVFLSTCNYYCNDPSLMYSNGITVWLERETSYTPDIVKAAIAGLHAVFREGFGYKSVVITLTDVLPEALQGNLWIDPMEDIKKRDFMAKLDGITRKYGRNAVILAKGIEKGSFWEMKRNHLSPCYTTRISEIPVVK